MKFVVKIEVDQDWWTRMTKTRISKKVIKGLISSSIEAALLGRGRIIDIKEDHKNN